MNRSLTVSFSLDGCIGCRACSESCPSYRNGGIDPQNAVSAVTGGLDVLKIWTCLQCHRCTMMCPQEIDVAGLMLALREIDARNGNVPEKYRRSASAVAKDGCVSVPKGRMEALRKELGLSDVAVDGKAVSELDRILKEAGFPYE